MLDTASHGIRQLQTLTQTGQVRFVFALDLLPPQGRQVAKPLVELRARLQRRLLKVPCAAVDPLNER